MISILLKSVKGINLGNNLALIIKLKVNFKIVFLLSLLLFLSLFNQVDASIINKSILNKTTLIKKNSHEQNVPILMYHYVAIAPASSTLKGLYLDPKIFESQLEEINKENLNSVFVSELAKNLINKKPLIKNSLVLTFDDGYEDFYTNVFPLLKKYKVKATIYIIINALDKPGYLTKDQLKELAQSKYVEIGSHTFNHLDLMTLNKRKADYEIVKSKFILEELIGRSILSFCYPFGHYNKDDVKLAIKAGYLASLTTQPGFKNSAADLQTLTRLRPGLRSGTEFSIWLKSFFANK